jgi:RHS repeat-associated protein
MRTDIRRLLVGPLFLFAAAAACSQPAAPTPPPDVAVFRSADTVAVAVTVLDNAGVPQSNVKVIAEDVAGNQDEFDYTNWDGVATLTMIESGEAYRFLAEVNGLDFPSGPPGSCVVPPCTSATITLPPPVTVTVRDDSGAPLQDVTVVVMNSDGDVGWQSTDQNGHAVTVLPPDSYTFRTRINGTDFLSSGPNCVVPGCTSATIVVDRAVVVTVVDDLGQPLSGLTVAALDSNGSEVSWQDTDGNGHALHSLIPDTYSFRTRFDGMDFWSTASCAVPGCVTATIVVPRPPTVSVVNDLGDPLSNMTVAAVNSDGAEVAWRSTDETGQTAVGLNAGTYFFRVSINGETFLSGPPNHCAVPGCLTATVVVPRPVVVTVVDAQGHPLADQYLNAHATEGGLDDGMGETDDNGQATFFLPAGHWQFQASCGSEYFFSGEPGHCAVPGCVTAQIVLACGQCTGKPDGTACNDGNACTQTDTCVAGACTGSNPVTCTAQDQCHNVGTCSEATGGCSNPPKTDGTACNDGNACTRSDTCVAGTCTGSNPVTCTAQDQCHDVGTCTPATGTCTNPPKTNGTACNDGNACTLTDTCQSGTCTGSNPVTCTAQDQCHDVGTCTPATGVCTNPAKTNGTACNDGNACTLTDTCQSGTCTGSNPVTCTAQDQCHDVGTCTPTTGVCTNPAKTNGTACNDGNACTLTDTCQSGTCTGSNPVSCTAQDQCHDVGTCTPATGTCTNPAKTNGTACNDGNACTQTDTCQSGTCTGSNPVTCTAQDVCHDVGTCDSSSGSCSNPQKPAGTSCGTSSACNISGQCVSLNQAPVVNAGPDQSANMPLGPKPTTSFTLQRLTLPFDSAQAVAYHPPTGKVLMSVNYPTGLPYNFELVSADGTRQQFSNVSGLGDEVYMTIARDEGGGHSLGGFLPGEMLFGTHVPGVIARMSPDGSSVANPWVTLPGETGQLRGQVYLDTTGVYGGDLLVTTTASNLWRVTSAGHATLVATMPAHANFEGLVSVPNDPLKYGPWAGKILVGDEGLPNIYAVDASGTITPYNLGINAEHMVLVRPNENFFGVDFLVVQNGGVVYGGSASQFQRMVGDILVGDEGGRLWHVIWKEESGFESEMLTRTDGWEGMTFAPSALAEVPASSVQVALAGTATDDGQPAGSTLSVSWSVASGPGPVTFANANAASTTATFTEPGTYVLVLTATDSVLTSSDQTTITINSSSYRNVAPTVSAGPNQVITLPDMADLSGTASDDGLPSGNPITLAWSEVSGPAPMTFVNPAFGLTQALFTAPGTYVLQLAASDGELTSTSTTTVTVNAAPSLEGGNLAVALSDAGPLTVGATETITTTLTDAQSNPIGGFPVQITVAGANPASATVSTNASGVATFAYQGALTGTDSIHAVALGDPTQLSSSAVAVAWIPATGSGPPITQGWIGSPAHQATLTGQVPVTLGSGVTLASGAVSYWSVSTPSQVHILANGVSGAPGATLATFDTTTLANGSYIIDLAGTDSGGHAQTNLVEVMVTGDYKPGRVVVEITDLTIPAQGMPITVGRRYDSLEKDRVGDFSYGWSLMIGHPRLEVDPAHNVALTMPNGRRVTFHFSGTPYPLFDFLFGPAFVPEAGTFGKLTSDGCPLLVLSGSQLVCFLESSPTFAPTTYTYTDPYGTVFTMGATGELRSIRDLQGNTLTFTSTGIVSSSGSLFASFTRDSSGRITTVTSPVLNDHNLGNDGFVYQYQDSGGNLTHVLLPGKHGAGPTYSYDTSHLLLTTKDGRDNRLRLSTYDTAGRLATDTDALGNVTRYAYDLIARTTTTTNPDTGVVTQTFDDRGLLLSETDPLGRITRHEYDADRNETLRTNALGEATSYTYDANGNQTSMTNARGEATHTTYNALSERLTSTDPLGHTTTITYDDNGIPIKFADDVGTLMTFTSSASGLALSGTDAAGNSVFLTYDVGGNVLARKDRLGRITKRTYDVTGVVTSTEDPRGAVTNFFRNNDGTLSQLVDATGVTGHDSRTYTYDNSLNLVSEASDEGRTTQYTYDTMNRLTQLQHTDGSTIRYTRDFRGNKLTETDEGGRIATYQYDLAGQLVKTIYADGTFTRRNYDDLGRLTSTTDERNNTTTYEYQTGCSCTERLTKVTDPLGHATMAAYDAAGRRISTTNAAGHTTSYRYDSRGHLVETDYPDGTSTQSTYDLLGRRVSMTDQTGAVTHYGYDAEGQLTSLTDALGNVTQYAYDPNGNLGTVTDANNHSTTYAYDALNRKIGRTLPLQMFETFAYNMYGNNTGHVDFRGKATTYTYDTRDHLLTKVPDPSLGEPTVTFTYNTSGTRATMADASGSTSYTYDSRDRLLTKVTPAGTLTYTYDLAGNLASIRSSNTNGTSVDYVWDAANRLFTVTDNQAGGITTAAYTTTGRPSLVTQPTGVAATYSYDTLDRALSLEWKHGTSPAFASWAYTFNDRGQRLSATDVTGRKAAYAYDAVARLASETITGDPRGAVGNGALSYTLDPVGNRLSRASTLAAVSTQAFTYNANDQLASDAYDLDGNTTTAGDDTYSYDFENRLVSKNAGAITIVYDGDGNRVAKTAGSAMTKYLVDDLNPTGYLQVLEELSGGTVQARYTYGSMVVSQARGSAVSFYGYDAHGNVGFLTDATGAVTDTYEYDAWGNLVGSTGTTVNTRLFAGEELDVDLGQINLRARQYDQSRGRFRTLDPAPGRLGQPASLNRYLYAGSDPVNLSDPSGRDILSMTALTGEMRQLQVLNKVLSKILAGAALSKAFRNSDYFGEYAAAMWIANTMAEINVGAAQVVSLSASGVALMAIYASIAGTWTAAPDPP